MDDPSLPPPLYDRNASRQDPGLTSDRSPDPESALRSLQPASHSSSLNGMVTKARNLRNRKVGIKDRIACFQWTWFTMTMVCRCLEPDVSLLNLC